MAKVSHQDSTKIIDTGEFTAFSTDCVVSPIGETTVEWISYTLSPSCDRITVTLNGTTATVTYDGLGLFDMLYLRYGVDNHEELLTTLSGVSFLYLPNKAKDIIEVQKDPSSIKSFTLLLNWISDIDSGSVEYQIDIRADYTSVKNWLQREVDKRR